MRSEGGMSEGRRERSEGEGRRERNEGEELRGRGRHHSHCSNYQWWSKYIEVCVLSAKNIRNADLSRRI